MKREICKLSNYCLRTGMIEELNECCFDEDEPDCYTQEMKMKIEVIK